MTDSPEVAPKDAAAVADRVAVPAGARPEELPPVEPPSAGYIVQLFLIPALIVAAVIGVWALFGKLADQETDWKQLTAELGSSNEHRRWRAALGLAQVLRNQQIRPDENGTPLAKQPEVANALAGLLQESLDSNSTLEDDVKHQEFLARTLGAIDVDEVVLPALARAVSADNNVEVRKSSLMSLAMIAGRKFAEQAEALDTTVQKKLSNGDPIYMLAEPLQKPSIENEAVWKEIKRSAQDEDPSIRHLSAFVTGLISGDEAMKVLTVMLLDGDVMARANAAVGFARSGRSDGVKILTQLLQEGTVEVSPAEFELLDEKAKKKALSYQQFEQPKLLGTCLHAVDMLWNEKLTGEEKETLRPILQKLADESGAADIRLLANSVLNLK